MNVWQHLTLSTLPIQQWRRASYLNRVVGLLRQWRKTSWLMQWSDVIGAGLVSLVFGLAPFISNSLIGVLLIACLGFWLLLTLSDEEAGSRAKTVSSTLTTPIHLLVFLYWSVASIATAISPVRRAALEGWSKLTLYLVLFALMARVLRSPRVRSWVIAVYLHVALLVSVYGLQQWFSGTAALATWVDPESPLSKTTRVYSYLGNPNLLAAYLIPAVMFSAAAVVAWRGWIRKALALTMTGVNGTCLILTFSRGGWIGLVMSTLVLLGLLVYWWSIYLPKFWRRWALPIAVGGAVGVLAVAVVAVPTLRDRASSIFVGRGDSSNNFRINVWMSVIEMIKARPLLGIGPGNDAFNLVYPSFMRARFSALSAYSIFLEVLVETGIIGFTCFLWLLSVTFYLGYRQLRRLRDSGNRDGLWLIAAIATLFGLIGHGIFDTVLYRPQVNTLWWLMFAMIASYYRGEEQPIKSVAPTDVSP